MKIYNVLFLRKKLKQKEQQQQNPRNFTDLRLLRLLIMYAFYRIGIVNRMMSSFFYADLCYS